MKSDGNNVLTLDPEKLPAHIGIIMDGNGRWAKKKLMNRVRGHEQGVQTVKTIVSTCRELGIQVLTLYAFSTENWGRPKAEVMALMKLLKKFITEERDELMEQGIRFNVVGQKERMPDDVERELDTAIELTQRNTGMLLNLALSYGSREEITAAVRNIAQKSKDGLLSPQDITPELISDHLYTRTMPDPDLIIRTSGEFRLSNFLMWQAAYAELYISSTLWPDFSKQELLDVLSEFQKRDRRFGKVTCSMPSDG